MSAKSETPRTDAFLRSQAPFTRDDVREILESVERDLAEVTDALNLLVCECELPGEEWESKQALRVARAVLDAARKEQP